MTALKLETQAHAVLVRRDGLVLPELVEDLLRAFPDPGRLQVDDGPIVRLQVVPGVEVGRRVLRNVLPVPASG